MNTMPFREANGLWYIPALYTTHGPYDNSTSLSIMRKAQIFAEEYGPMANPLSEMRASIGLDTALFIVRTWRAHMDAQVSEDKPFKTPNLLNCLRYVCEEAQEVSTTWMKQTLPDPRNRPPQEKLEDEVTDTALMILTAFSTVENMSFGKWLLLEQIHYANSILPDIYKDPWQHSHWTDHLLEQAVKAKELYRKSPMLWSVKEPLFYALWTCVCVLEDRFFWHINDRLTQWEKKWHPAGEIVDMEQPGLSLLV